MTVSLFGIPFAPYDRQLISTAFKRAGKSGNIVSALIRWSDYGAGSALSEFVVQLLFSQSGTIPQGFKPLSIYINNLGSDLPIYVFFPDTGYEVVAPPNSEGWYPIIANALIAWVGGLNFQDGFIPITTIFFTDLEIPPYVNIAVPETVVQELASAAVGGQSAELESVTIEVEGQSYTGAGLSVTGGGGTGATVNASLDIWGRFIGTGVTNPGGNFTGPPTVLPTASNPAAAAFNGASTYTPGIANSKVTYAGTEWYFNGPYAIQCGAAAWGGGVNYSPPTQVEYNDLIYQCVVRTPTGCGGPNPPPPSDPTHWQLVGSDTPNSVNGNWINSGSPGGIDASFQATITSTLTNIQTGGLGVPALGDQLYSKTFGVSGNGTLDGNVFGSPFGSGFIYINNIFVVLMSTGNAQFTLALQTAGGAVIWKALCLGTQIIPLQIGNCNVKLDATQTYELVVSSASAAGNINVAFAYTISEI